MISNPCCKHPTAAQVGYDILGPVIRDNVIVNTKGPGIMVYGAADPSKVSLVARNFVAGSRTSSAIVVGGGPVIIRNNILTTSAEAGIGVEDYGRRGFLRGIVLANNSIYGNTLGGILIAAQGLLEMTIVNNAAQPRAGTPAFPSARAGVLSLGNTDCALLRCFVDPDQLDFTLLASHLGSVVAEPGVPVDDYFGRRRDSPPTAGAIEGAGQPILLGIKPGPR